MEDREKAIVYLGKSKNQLKLDRKPPNEARYLRAEAYLLKYEKKYEESLESYKTAYKIYQNLNETWGVINTSLEMGFLHIKLNDQQNAIKSCADGYELALEIKDLDNQKRACDCLNKAYELNNQHEKSLYFLRKSIELKDSIESTSAQVALQNYRFENELRTDSIAAIERELAAQIIYDQKLAKQNRHKTYLGFGAFIFLLLSAGFYGRWRHVNKSKIIIEKEKERSDNLLLNILPAEVAEELKIHGKAEARDFDMVSILFTDFKGFTEASAKLSASELVTEINTCFEVFDHIMEEYKIEKIKTIGDAYMAAGGLPVPTDDSIKNTVLAALEMQAFIEERHKTREARGEPAFQMRVGIHTGPVVAGIVGVKKFQYDIWGDTVNTASRMESSSQVGKVNSSQATYDLLKGDTDFAFESRGKIEAKGKGEMEMYFVVKRESHDDHAKA